MSDYTKKWKASCPRCSKQWNQSMLTCKNCDYPEIRAYVDTLQRKHFGCERCDEATTPTCSCGSNLSGVAKIGLLGLGI